ncbi:hypothetical protein Pint_17103 [Pistacia integerrima]|uniref:Uncharacterized protein n=1 Tax=Pistacia integerrima TaxID=434235 RepID=A0ACC0YY45_9ROSI|nr:hypothetical protein Pint_17103 [Pistacia integerrima]
MVHGILQFTPSIAFRYVLHRCESRDIRCRESLLIMKEGHASRARTVSGATGASSLVKISLAQFAPGFVNAQRRGNRRHKRATDTRRSTGFDNDPSAGSPTETLLRLLLPLNDKVQWTSRDVAGSEPPAAIRTLHRTIQSVGATGGVYKGQGRSQRELMTRAY